MTNNEVEKIIEQLSPLEKKIIPFINLKYEQIKNKAEIDDVSLTRALMFLESKKIITLNKKSEKIVDLGTNGIRYKKNNLPERNLLRVLEKENHSNFERAQTLSKLSDNEFKISLGVLKNKDLIKIKNGKIALTASKEELTKKTPEEQLLEKLPCPESSLNEEEKSTLEVLKKRKEIVEIYEHKEISISLTELGKELAGKEINVDLIEEITPEIIRYWKRGRKFRKYDIRTKAPRPLNGGKKHFVNQSIEYAKRIWLDMGFKEMTGTITQTSFWNFDALFTAQDHIVREMQDTFLIKGKEGKLPSGQITSKVKQAHESGVDSSKGWQYNWQEKEAKRIVLRTHTTAISAQTLAQLKESDIPAKYFTIGKVFRNETLDWKHGFEFYQTEGIVVDKNANFNHLMGYLKEFYKKMGFEKIKFFPTYYAFTEPSVEIQVFHPEKKEWLELGGGGIFRPEVTIPLLGKNIPVLAWGQGFDRIIMDYYNIKDLREMYSNDIKCLREKKVWLK